MPIKKLENLHIPLWLLKDICWMLEAKWLGMIMIVPTVTVAFVILIKTIKTTERYINLAICFWIMANAYWMCCEFTGHVDYKNYAIIPFLLGLASSSVFYVKSRVLTTSE